MPFSFIPHEAIVSSNLTQGNTIDNVANISAFPQLKNTSVSTYILRSQRDDTYDSLPFNSHIRPLIEPNAGAHYYVEGEYNSRYIKQSCVIDLANTQVNTANNMRRAYICLSMVTEGTLVQMADIGLGNYTGRGLTGGPGWFVMSWAPTLAGDTLAPTEESFGFGEENPIPPGSKIKIEYSLCAKNEEIDRVAGSFYNLTTGGNEFARIVYEGPAGSLFKREADHAKWRCKRFMSLVPRVLNPPDPKNPIGADIADGSFLKAVMKELTLYPHQGSPSPWGDGTGQMELYRGDICFAWILQPNNIPRLKIAHYSQNKPNGPITCYDEAHIFHQFETHR